MDAGATGGRGYIVGDPFRGHPELTTEKNRPSAHLRVNAVALHDGYHLRRIVVLHSYHVEAAVRAQEVLHCKKLLRIPSHV